MPESIRVTPCLLSKRFQKMTVVHRQLAKRAKEDITMPSIVLRSGKGSTSVLALGAHTSAARTHGALSLHLRSRSTGAVAFRPRLVETASRVPVFATNTPGLTNPIAVSVAMSVPHAIATSRVRAPVAFANGSGASRGRVRGRAAHRPAAERQSGGTQRGGAAGVAAVAAAVLKCAALQPVSTPMEIAGGGTEGWSAGRIDSGKHCDPPSSLSCRQT